LRGIWGGSEAGFCRGLGPGTEVEETLEGKVVLAVVAGFVAAEVVEEAGVVGEVAEGACGLGGVLGGGEVSEFGGTVFGFVADDGAFETPGAEATPAGDGHAVDDVLFDFVGGLELGAEGFEEAGETLGGFVGQDYGSSEETVLGGVAGGVGFAFGGEGALGFGSV